MSELKRKNYVLGVADPQNSKRVHKTFKIFIKDTNFLKTNSPSKATIQFFFFYRKIRNFLCNNELRKNIK